VKLKALNVFGRGGWALLTVVDRSDIFDAKIFCE
jgi:hypothetical protein